jgi:hypothetical protein
MNKQDLIRRLRESPVLQASLESVEDPQEKAVIADRAMEFVSGVADALVPVVQQVMDNPELAQLLRKELLKRTTGRSEGVVTK